MAMAQLRHLALGVIVAAALNPCTISCSKSFKGGDTTRNSRSLESCTHTPWVGGVCRLDYFR